MSQSIDLLADVCTRALGLPSIIIYQNRDAPDYVVIGHAGISNTSADRLVSHINDTGVAMQLSSLVSQRVIQIPRTIITNQPEAPEANGSYFILCIPLRHHDIRAALGILLLPAHSHSAFTCALQANIAAVTNLVGTQLYDQKRCNAYIQLAHAAHNITMAPDVRSAVQIVVDTARALTFADSSMLILGTTNSHHLVIGAHSPQDTISHKPDRLNALAATLLEAGSPTTIDETLCDSRLEAICDSGIRSLTGVPVGVGRSHGALYVSSIVAHHFGPFDKKILCELAGFVPMALAQCPAVESSSECIESAIDGLFYYLDVIRELEAHIARHLDFEFVAIQLIDPSERVIETVYGTGVARDMVGLARHKLDRPPQVRDIQADIACSDPPRVEIIVGKDVRFDPWIYDKFDHQRFCRIWVPIVVVKDGTGMVNDGWPAHAVWRVLDKDVSGELPLGNASQCCRLQLDDLSPIVGEHCIEIIGTVEAGVTLPHHISSKDATNLAILISECVVKDFQLSCREDIAHSKYLSLRKVLLPYALEQVTFNAMKLSGASMARLHFDYNHCRNTYAYEVYAGRKSVKELKGLRPRHNGLGAKALRSRKVQTDPNISCGNALDHLAESNPAAWSIGIRAVAAFPFFLGGRHGLLYLCFSQKKVFLEHELSVTERLVSHAIDAIRRATRLREAIETSRRLSNLDAMARSIAVTPRTHNLLRDIAGSTRNILRGDLVFIREYGEMESVFSSGVHVAGKYLVWDGASSINFEVFADLVSRKGGDLVISLSSKEKVSELPESVLSNLREEGIEMLWVVPIVMRTGGAVAPRGLMVIAYRQKEVITEEDRKLLNVLMSAAALSISVGRANRTVRKNELTISALTALSHIAARVHNGAYDEEMIFRLFLTGVTAKEGLGFSRALVFVLSDDERILKGCLAIGAQSRNEAESTWSRLDNIRAKSESQVEVLRALLDETENFACTIGQGAAQDTQLSLAVRDVEIILSGSLSTLVGSLRSGNLEIVPFNREDEARDVLARVSQGDRGRTFVCVPLVSTGKRIGVMVVDNRFRDSEQNNIEVDEVGLKTFANMMAMSVDNARAREVSELTGFSSLIRHQVFEQLSKLATRVDFFISKVPLNPFAAELFWNTDLGDEWQELLKTKNTVVAVSKRLRDLQKDSKLSLAAIRFDSFVQQMFEQFVFGENVHKRFAAAHGLYISCDAVLICSAIESVFSNTRQALLESGVADPVVEVRVAGGVREVSGTPFCEVWVVDNGPGVPEAMKETIFNPSVSQWRKREGDGWGLVFAKKYIEQHGGTIREVGEHGTGAKFVIQLPGHERNLRP